MWISGFYFVTVLTYRHTRQNVVRKLKFKIWQYVIFFQANWLVFFSFNFIKNQYCVKISAIKFIMFHYTSNLDKDPKIPGVAP